MRLSDIMSHMQLTIYPIIGLVIFLIVFGLVAARALSKRRGEEYRRTAQLPLQDELTPAAAGITPRREGGPA